MYTKEILEKEGYRIENARITAVSLNMRDHACLSLDLILEGNGWSMVYGGYCLGHGYLGAEDEDFQGSAAGMEAIMMIMNTVGVSDLSDLKNKYIRVALGSRRSDSVKIIGNIIKDKWFDYRTFFEDKEMG